MDIDPMEIYKLLPRIDCGQCPAESCLAFAAAVLEDCKRLRECSRLTDYSRMMIEAVLCRGK